MLRTGFLVIERDVASLFCAILLGRSYRRTHTRLLMWSTLCFVGLTINNVLLFVDLVLIPGVDLAIVRSVLMAA